MGVAGQPVAGGGRCLAVPSVVPTAAELAQEDLAAGWAAPPAQAPRPALDRGPAFSFTNTLYYFGGMLAIGAMTLFMTLGWELFGAWACSCWPWATSRGRCWWRATCWRRACARPPACCAALAVCLVPLAVWAFQSGIGLWPEGGPDSYRDYHRYIDWRWLTLELATLAAAVVLLYRYKLPFMVMPVAVTIWYLSMDVAHMLMQKDGFDWTFTRDVSLVFGLATCAIAVWVDLRTRTADNAEDRQDFAFWLYLFGAIMFWGGLSLRDSDSELNKFLYALINVFLVFSARPSGGACSPCWAPSAWPATWATWPTACSRTACCSRSRSPCWAWGWWRWASGGSATKTASTPGWPTGCRQH